MAVPPSEGFLAWKTYYGAANGREQGGHSNEDVHLVFRWHGGATQWSNALGVWADGTPDLPREARKAVTFMRSRPDQGYFLVFAALTLSEPPILAGLAHAWSSEMMLLDSSTLERLALPRGLTPRRAHSEEDRLSVAKINATATDRTEQSWLDELAAERTGADLFWAAILSLDGRDVSCAAGVVKNETLSLALVATVPDQQRQGYGELACREALCQARDAQHRHRKVVIAASSEGQGSSSTTFRKRHKRFNYQPCDNAGGSFSMSHAFDTYEERSAPSSDLQGSAAPERSHDHTISSFRAVSSADVTASSTIAGVTASAGARVCSNPDVSRLILDCLVPPGEPIGTIRSTIKPYLTISREWPTLLEERRNRHVACSFSRDFPQKKVDPSAAGEEKSAGTEAAEDLQPRLRPLGMVSYFKRRPRAREQVKSVHWVYPEHGGASELHNNEVAWDDCWACNSGEEQVAALLDSLPIATTLTLQIEAKGGTSLPVPRYTPIRKMRFSPALANFGGRLQSLTLVEASHEIFTAILRLTPYLECLRIRYYKAWGRLGDDISLRLKELSIESYEYSDQDHLEQWSDAAMLRNYVWEEGRPVTQVAAYDESGFKESDLWGWILQRMGATLQRLNVEDSIEIEACHAALYAANLPQLEELSVNLASWRRYDEDFDFSRLPPPSRRLVCVQLTPTQAVNWPQLWPGIARLVQRGGIPEVKLVFQDHASMVNGESYLPQASMISAYILREGCRFFAALDPLKAARGLKLCVQWQYHQGGPVLRFSHCGELLQYARGKKWLSDSLTASELCSAKLGWEYGNISDSDPFSKMIWRKADEASRKMVDDRAMVVWRFHSYQRQCKFDKTTPLEWPREADGDLVDWKPPAKSKGKEVAAVMETS